MKFNTIYNYQSPEGFKFTMPSMVQAQFKDECDINRIMDRYMRTGCLSDPLSQRQPGTYGDFADMGDYMDNMNKIVKAREMFDSLPSKVRERFGNNPAEMIKFVMDNDNRAEAKKLGLLKEEIVVDNSNVNSGTESSSTNEDGKQSIT